MPNMAAYDLQRAVFAKLAATTALITRLGGARIYDDVPSKPDYPFISFGPHSEKDWSTGTETASEHSFSLHVWSKSPSREEVTALIRLARSALETLPTSLESHRLVNFRHEQSDVEREDAGQSFKGTLRFRAVLEPV